MSKNSFAKKFVAMFLAGTMAALGCVGTPESDPDVKGDVVKESRQRVSLEYGAGEFHTVIDLSRLQGEDMFQGTMTVMGADGIPHIKDVEYPADAASIAPKIVTDPAGQRWLEVENTRLEVTSYVKTESGVDITFLSPDGVEFFFSQSGTGEFFALPAAVILGIVGIGVCGVVILASIAACAYRDRCWEYSLTGGLTAICTGKCVACAPTPSPTASATPAPTATATATPVSTPVSTPTATPTSTPSSTPVSSPAPTATGSPSAP
jgi:hypothetical protein